MRKKLFCPFKKLFIILKFQFNFFWKFKKIQFQIFMFLNFYIPFFLQRSVKFVWIWFWQADYAQLLLWAFWRHTKSFSKIQKRKNIRWQKAPRVAHRLILIPSSTARKKSQFLQSRSQTTNNKFIPKWQLLFSAAFQNPKNLREFLPKPATCTRELLRSPLLVRWIDLYSHVQHGQPPELSLCAMVFGGPSWEDIRVWRRRTATVKWKWNFRIAARRRNTFIGGWSLKFRGLKYVKNLKSDEDVKRMR